MAVNYDGMNGSEMDTLDSRKRPLDGETDNGVTKRSNQGGGENIHLKILVPSIAAGAIIGKGGETIAQVQKDAGARVKMSKANDFYPGTTERVCLIMGPVEAVRQVHNFVMEKIREKPDPNPKMDETKSTFERHRQVKILVPNSTAGMIIGKAGNFIKQIKEESGAYVQISQKSKETNLPERCVTVAGDFDSNTKAIDMILQKIVEDPQSGSCPNISYADYTGPVASANPTGSPFANSTFIQNRGQEMAIGNNNFAGGGGFGFGFNGNASMATGMNFNTGAPGTMSGASIDNLKVTLRGSGFTDQATEEISQAMNTLANYGILGMGLGLGVNNIGNVPQNMSGNTGIGNLNLGTPAIGSTPLMTSTSSASGNVSQGSPYLNTSNNSASATSLFGPVGSGSSGLGSSGSTGANSSLFGSSSPSVQQERYGSSPMLNDSFSSAMTYPSTAQGFPASDRSPNISVNQNSFGLGTGMYSPTEDKSSGTTKQDLEVAESIVGAILGPGGKGIVEIQQYTGTNIQISKKGVYTPGTRNRIVSITGTPSNITKAQYMIQQRIQQEEYKRARQASGH
ncbi:RNA-binding protein Nova-1-like isoform X2 [Gigantopelta aegis]|uniref:RNA-binding protein Nova-1-like isoform X2 n=1 Tax=Gigantopelta aegis TaxID=1735272 RepID=UPI001B88C930|nr:RNA-binding protein Nova-1-like isoform X2 [Gigantopelta aegis]